MQMDIIVLAEIIGAVSVVVGSIVGVYRLYDKLVDRMAALEQRIGEAEKELDSVKKEDALVIYALRACLDGLHQQGCNGRVTEAINRIDRHINQAAHGQQ